MLSHAELVDEQGVRRRILELSPLAVAPAMQRRGIGCALVPAGLAAAEAMGEPLVVLQGSPGYYPRFGFRDCRAFGIEIDLPDWAPPDAGMAYPLSTYDPSLRGHLIEPPAFAAVG
jgi:putative acetyltransferase